jgi:hypothetical protein
MSQLYEESMQAKLKHLEMLQGIINRMAQNSFMLKGWSVLIISALFALAAKDSQGSFVYVGYFPAIIFWILDGYFLMQERLFRRQYNKVCTLTEEQIDFSMSTGEFKKNITLSGAIFSKTLIIFHSMILIVLIVVTLIINKLIL